MQHKLNYEPRGPQGTPIWMWPLMPVLMLVGPLILLALAIWSIPYFWLYPERHMQLADCGEGTPAEVARLARRRASCARLTFAQRIGIAIRRSRRGTGAA